MDSVLSSIYTLSDQFLAWILFLMAQVLTNTVMLKLEIINSWLSIYCFRLLGLITIQYVAVSADLLQPFQNTFLRLTEYDKNFHNSVTVILFDNGVVELSC